MDIRSFRLNFEVGAIVADSHFASLMETRFRSDLARSREVLPADVSRRSFPARLVYGAVKLLSPLL
jgi:cardiolipin synthase